MSYQSGTSYRKQIKDEKTGQEKTIEIRKAYQSVPLERLALVCEICGYELPYLKIKMYSPVLCPNGCGIGLQARITKTLSQTRWNDNPANLKIRDKFEIKRVK